MKKKGNKNLTYAQRIMLEDCMRLGIHKKIIAKKLGVCLATVYNELKRGEYLHKQGYSRDYWGERRYRLEKRYSSNKAEENYRLNMSTHGAPLKIGNDYEFVQYVEKRVIKDKISPCAVLGEIKRQNKFRTNISKTTMYRYIEQGIFSNIRLCDLPMYKRKKRYRKTVIKRVSKGRNIEQRPKEIALRDSFGHWEMDCVIGKKFSRDTLLVFTERKTRYEIVMRMPNRKSATVVSYIDKLEERYGALFPALFKSITVDNGSEFSDFCGLEQSINGKQRTFVYYCHPYCSCERGSNERINRDIRRWLPKGSDFSKYSDEQIEFVQKWINDYPREIFNFGTSAEEFEKELSKISV